MRAAAFVFLIACGSPAPAAVAPSTTLPAAAIPLENRGDRFADCASACAQHCNTVGSERLACEMGQVRCGCAPGMRRPVATAEPIAPVTGEPPMPTTAPGCFGGSLPLTIWGGTPYAEAHFGEAHGLFLLDYGTTSSTLDASALDPAPSSRTPEGRDLGCFPGMNFFRAWSCLPLVAQDHGSVGAPFPQAGIFGIDVLGRHPYVLDYRGGRVHSNEPEAFCSDAALEAAGLLPLSTSDFGTHRTRLGVPAITVRIGGGTAVAQLDTGFADRRVRHSININRAFFDRIAGSLVRLPERDLTLSTCAGVPEPVTAYAIASGALELLGEGDAVVRAWQDATVFLKETPAAARRCGGIGTWTEPGAQLGASFLEDAGLVAFDPGSGRVWMATE